MATREYVQGLMGGQNVIVFICSFVGINAVCEMISATVITGMLWALHFIKQDCFPAQQLRAQKQ